jgi:hypothetical protein
MIARLHKIEDVDFARLCEQTIPAMDDTSFEWPAGIATYGAKLALLRARTEDLLAQRNGMGFVIREGADDQMVGVGIYSRGSYRMLLTFYSPSSAPFALTPEFIDIWMGWLKGRGFREIIAPVPASRRAAIIRMFDLTDDDFAMEAGEMVARLWHDGTQK